MFLVSPSMAVPSSNSIGHASLPGCSTACAPSWKAGRNWYGCAWTDWRQQGTDRP
jgi:hypothetical protein